MSVGLHNKHLMQQAMQRTDVPMTALPVGHAVLMSIDDEREELVRLVTFLMSAEGTEEELDAA